MSKADGGDDWSPDIAPAERERLEVMMSRLTAEAEQALGTQVSELIARFKGKSPEEMAAMLDLPTVWAGLDEDFEAYLSRHILEIARLGAAEAANRLADQMQFNLPFEQARQWAAEHSARLVREIEETTQSAIRERVTTAISRGVNPLQFEQELAELLKDMPVWRAKRIANTEVMTAYHEGKLQSFRESGVVWGKRWRAASTGSCKTCMRLDGQIVALGQPFDAGGLEIMEGRQAHPNCRCTVQPVTFREAAALGLIATTPEVGPVVPKGTENSSIEMGNLALFQKRYGVNIDLSPGYSMTMAEAEAADSILGKLPPETTLKNQRFTELALSDLPYQIDPETYGSHYQQRVTIFPPGRQLAAGSGEYFKDLRAFEETLLHEVGESVYKGFGSASQLEWTKLTEQVNLPEDWNWKQLPPSEQFSVTFSGAWGGGTGVPTELAEWAKSHSNVQ